jgi:phosphopentomutase
MKKTDIGFIFTNLVDFDMLWGHRNDSKGFAGGLEYLDQRIPEMLEALDKEDILIFTSDHGNDPTDLSTDHTREYVPLLIYGNKLKSGMNLGERDSFSDLAATVADFFGVPKTKWGKSFLPEISQ